MNQSKCMRLLLSSLLLLSTSLIAAEQTTEEEDAWWAQFEERSADDVNDGELVFLSELPAGSKPVHHHSNIMRLEAASLETGWIQLEQCHRNLDQVEKAQIVYRAERIRNLHITRAENMQAAWVEGHTVQLTHIKADAELCIQAQSRTLWHQPDGSYLLRNGPFMRNYLDGYYPMRVTLKVEYPTELLAFDSMQPEPQVGLNLEQAAQALNINTLFEGRLLTQLRFTKTASDKMQQ